MSLFSAILNKLGFGTTPAAASPTTVADAQPSTAATPVPSTISQVDVVAMLDGMAAANPQKLSWKVSIVDLLKLLSLDSSLEARKGLAVELDCPADKLADSAQMNIWLHKTVLQRLAANGGNIPQELL